MGATIAIAWDDCPFGMENDPYPGSCPRYIDVDGDGICDHSQPPPDERNGNVSAISTTSLKITSTTKVIVTFLLVLFLILVTEIVAKKYERQTRYMWNLILLILFMVSALSGVALLLIKNLTLLNLHTISSLLLMWVGLYHVIKRYKYYVAVKRK